MIDCFFFSEVIECCSKCLKEFLNVLSVYGFFLVFCFLMILCYVMVFFVLWVIVNLNLVVYICFGILDMFIFFFFC